MRAARLLAIVVGALALTSVSASAADRTGLVQASGATFPDRSFVLTLSSARSLTVRQVRVTENGVRVADLSLVGQSPSNRYVLDYRSTKNPGTQIAVRATVKGVGGVLSAKYRAPALHIVPAPVYKPSLVDRIVQSTLMAVLVALAVVAVIGWGIAVVLRQRAGTLLKRVGSFVHVTQVVPARKRAEIAAQRLSDPVERTRQGISQLRVWQKLESMLEVADIKLTAGQVVLLTAVATALVGLVLELVLGPVGVLLALATPLVARSLIYVKLNRKRRRFSEQLPDCLEVLASALRAGHTLGGALSVVIENAAEPSKSEFQRVEAEEKLGVPLEDALQVAVVRMDSRDLDQVALVARLQRETGSNSAEVLDRVVETVRARVELRRQVYTLTAPGRFSRWILTAIPVALALMLSAINPGYLHPLFAHGFGRFLLVSAALMVVSGSLIIRKIVDIKV